MNWILPTDYLPNPSGADDDIYLVTLDWGFKRPLQLAVARFAPSPGRESLGHWKLAYWPQRHLPLGVVTAWQPAPEAYGPAPAPAGKEGAR
jgi:hypothetical protein